MMWLQEFSSLSRNPDGQVGPQTAENFFMSKSEQLFNLDSRCWEYREEVDGKGKGINHCARVNHISPL